MFGLTVKRSNKTLFSVCMPVIRRKSTVRRESLKSRLETCLSDDHAEGEMGLLNESVSAMVKWASYALENVNLQGTSLESQQAKYLAGQSVSWGFICQQLVKLSLDYDKARLDFVEEYD